VHLLHRKDYASPFKLQRRLQLGAAHQHTTATATSDTADASTTTSASTTAAVAASSSSSDEATATTAAATAAAAAGDDSSTTIDSATDSSSDGYAYPGMPAVPEPFMVPLLKDSRDRRKRGKSCSSITSSDGIDRKRDSSSSDSKLEQETGVDSKAKR
jgi:hypothetical protein